MAKTEFRSVDEYIAAQPAPAQPVLERVRSAMRKALPGAEEIVSYQIPAYRSAAGVVIYFAGWKKHYAVYPVSAALAGAFDGALDSYRAHKDTLRFPLDEPVPVRWIERIARLRAKEAERHARARQAAKAKPKSAANGRRTARAVEKAKGTAKPAAGVRRTATAKPAAGVQRTTKTKPVAGARRTAKAKPSRGARRAAKA